MKVFVLVLLILTNLFSSFGMVEANGLGHRLLELGMEGSDVRHLQRVLTDLGYHLQVDGIFGEETEGVVKQLQEGWGLTPDGIVGPLTHTLLKNLQKREVTHIVQPGDTLYELAQEYNTSIEEIAKLNSLSSSLIRPGDKLVVARGPVAVPASASNRAPEFIWPLQGPVTSPFGWRNHPVTGNRHFHEGIDIAAPQGTLVRAGADGVVITAGWLGAFGRSVVIDHGGGYTTWYGHNSQLLVTVGERVRQGQEIAKVGATGVATGPHLDFRIKIGDRVVDPTNYLP